MIKVLTRLTEGLVCSVGAPQASSFISAKHWCDKNFNFSGQIFKKVNAKPTTIHTHSTHFSKIMWCYVLFLLPLEMKWMRCNGLVMGHTCALKAGTKLATTPAKQHSRKKNMRPRGGLEVPHLNSKCQCASLIVIFAVRFKKQLQ